MLGIGRESWQDICISTYIYIYIHTYLYIYIYIYMNSCHLTWLGPFLQHLHHVLPSLLSHCLSWHVRICIPIKPQRKRQVIDSPPPLYLNLAHTRPPLSVHVYLGWIWSPPDPFKINFRRKTYLECARRVEAWCAGPHLGVVVAPLPPHDPFINLIATQTLFRE